MKFTRKKIIIFLSFLLSLFFSLKYNLVDAAGVLGFDTSTPCNYWKDVFNFALSAAGILTVGVFILGGIYYIVSLGEQERLQNAKALMTGAITGFILAVTSWLLFSLLTPTLLQCKLELPEINLPNVSMPERDNGSGSGGTGTGNPSNPCAGVAEEDLFNSEEECMNGWDGICRQQDSPQAGGTNSGESNTSCTINTDCPTGQQCVGTTTDPEGQPTNMSGSCQASDGNSQSETTGQDSSGSPSGARWCRLPNPSGLYEEMMSFCNRSGSGNNVENYRNVINNWRNILPGVAVYVGGGYMAGGICNASGSDSYLEQKLQSGEGYRSQWVDPVGGNMSQAVSNYRAWAISLGGTYCGDCLTFSRTLYQCVGAPSNVMEIRTNRSSAAYYFNNPREFDNALQNGGVQMTPGSFIWFGEGCGHAINYTGISGAEIIEMGGASRAITANGHRANTVNVVSTLHSYLSGTWVSGRSCPVFVHRLVQ